MRSILCIFAMLVILPTVALSQSATQPAPDEQQMLKFVLQSWEQAMGKLDSFSATCTRKAEDKTFGGTDIFTGSAKFQRFPKQPSRALLYMESKKNPANFEKFLYTGTYLYEWVPATKVLRVYEVQQAKAGQPAMEENIIALLTGMTSAAAQQRYTMKWVPDKTDNNKFYHYIQIFPKTPQDKADFTEARLVLWSKSFLPRQIWYHEPNGNTKTWDFEITPNDPKVTATTFAPPQALEKGWRVEQVKLQQAGGTPPRK